LDCFLPGEPITFSLVLHQTVKVKQLGRESVICTGNEQQDSLALFHVNWAFECGFVSASVGLFFVFRSTKAPDRKKGCSRLHPWTFYVWTLFV